MGALLAVASCSSSYLPPPVTCCLPLPTLPHVEVGAPCRYLATLLCRNLVTLLRHCFCRQPWPTRRKEKEQVPAGFFFLEKIPITLGRGG